VMRLALTTVNKESLVFHSPYSKDALGVLFCSDSDLRFVPPLPRMIGLATAPHHGSESNATAYHRINQGGVLNRFSAWVRSDSRSRPGPSFVNRQERKFCTRCRPHGVSRHDVVLGSSSRVWGPQPGIVRCSCI
jgi:hypothetical protein